MKEPVHIVGAGLAGLVAAVNLRREGREVVIHEREPDIGGDQRVRPDPAGSPFDLPRVARYCGVDIGSACKPIDKFSFISWGKKYEYQGRPEIPTYMVERGNRDTSLDHLLYQAAQEAGAEVRFGEGFETKNDFETLPEGSIVATGLRGEPFRILGIPNVLCHSYYTKGKPVARKDTTVTIYSGDYTKDYGFTSTINGIGFAMLFQKEKPLDRAACEEFRREAEAHEGIDFGDFEMNSECVSPAGSWRNPILFKDGLIITGSLAGAMDPILCFGMLGAMLSGKIAARAVSDPDGAQREFNRLNLLYQPSFAIKKGLDALPRPLQIALSRAFIPMYRYAPAVVLDTMFMFVPGYRRMG